MNGRQLIGLARVQANLRGWVSRRIQQKEAELVARKAATMRILTSWARRRYLRGLFWKEVKLRAEAEAKVTLANLHDPRQPLSGEPTLDPDAEYEAMGTGAADDYSDSTNAVADLMVEYCGLAGVDARIKQGTAKLLSALGTNRDVVKPPTMTRVYNHGRSLRIFLSSTFRDMNSERDTFVKRYASALRQLAKERGVFVTFVDLRCEPPSPIPPPAVPPMSGCPTDREVSASELPRVRAFAGGVTVAQATGGEVVHICLKQLQESRYFVNFLGLRYGWSPAKEDLTAQTFDNYGHMINSYIPGRSVTEVEVISGALGWGAKAVCAPTNAFFYMRADAFCDGISADQKDAFVDADPKVQRKLMDLKRRIRARAAESDKYDGLAVSKAKLPFVECCREYEQPEDFAKLLYDDLLVAIKRDFPQKKIRSALDEQFMRHLHFASQHCRVYVGHQDVQRQIDEYVAGAGTAAEPRKPLIIVGDSGSGKSAALSNWMMKASAVQGFVLPHFCGSAENSSSHDGIIQRLAAELKRAFGFEAELPEDTNELMELVPKWIRLACVKTPVTIILDGMDQAMDPEASKLPWLPLKGLPRNCSLLLSTAKDTPLYDTLARRSWLDSIVMIPKLSMDDKEEVVTKVLKNNHKTLEDYLLLMIAKAKNTATPLFLHMVLEELMANAVFETLHSLIVMCLKQSSANELAKLVLERLEGQFSATVVRALFSYVEASRFGMSEMELMEALKMAQADWSHLFAAVRSMLCESAGLLNISSHVMHAAVKQRYFTDDASTKAIHGDLLNFFTSVSPESVSETRRCTELPFQMIHSGELDKLSVYLVDIGRVRHLLADPSLARDLASLWQEANKGQVPQDLGPKYIEALECYEPVLRREVAANLSHMLYSETEDAYLEELTQLCGQVGNFLVELYQFEGAAILHQRALDIDRGRLHDKSEKVAEDMRRLANTQSMMGLYEDAINAFYSALGIYSHHASNDPSARVEYAQTLFEMAGVVRYLEDPSRARIQCLSALRTFRQVLGEDNPRVCAYARSASRRICRHSGSSFTNVLLATPHCAASACVRPPCSSFSGHGYGLEKGPNPAFAQQLQPLVCLHSSQNARRSLHCRAGPEGQEEAMQYAETSRRLCKVLSRRRLPPLSPHRRP